MASITEDAQQPLDPQATQSTSRSDVKSTPLSNQSSFQSDHAVRRTFLVMCFCFSLNHATQSTAIAYASTALASKDAKYDVGSASNAVLYGVCLFSSLFLGPLSVGLAGPKKGLLLGMSTYVVYVLSFGAAIFYPAGSHGRWAFAIGGSVVGGVGAGMLWTCQGAFFTAVADSLCESGSLGGATSRMNVTSKLSSTFAMWYLGMECLCKAAYALIQQHFPMSAGAGFVLFGALAAVATVAFAFSEDVRGSTVPPNSSCCGKAVEAVRLWPDPKIWLMSGMNLGFGFAAAWVNGYVNAVWLHEALHNPSFIGFLSALICLVATVSAKVYGFICHRLGSKLPVACFGSLCLFSISAMSLVTAPDGLGPGGWGWGIVSFYVLLGLGRGVYESTNKGIFSDFYPGERGTGAFANCVMQNVSSSAIGFAFGALKVNEPVKWLLMGSTALTMPGLVTAYMLQRRSEQLGKDVRSSSTSFLADPSS